MDLTEAIDHKLREIEKAAQHPACVKLRQLQADVRALERAGEILAAASKPKSEKPRAVVLRKGSTADILLAHLKKCETAQTAEPIARMFQMSPSSVRQALKPHLGTRVHLDPTTGAYSLLGQAPTPAPTNHADEPELFFNPPPQAN